MKKRPLCVATVFFVVWIISIKIVDRDYTQKYNFLLEEEQSYIKAIVTTDGIEREYKKVYEIEIQEINGDKEYKGNKWLLHVKKSKNSKVCNLKYGDLIEFNGKIEIPSTARNYKGFDYQKYLKSKKIYGIILLTESVNIVSYDKYILLNKSLHDIRINIKERVYSLLPINARELCVGILIGERTDIDDETINAFKDSNLTHMLAVSGAHISYIILGISILFCKIGNRFCKYFTIIFLIFFMALTGFTPSVQRASIMAIFMLLANLVYKKSNVYMNLCFSSLIILICNPYAIFDIGFQLSYGGTIGIILLNPKISIWLYSKVNLERFGIEKNKYKNFERMNLVLIKTLKYIIDMFIVTISANLIIIPIMALQFNTISFTFWISNILAGPLLGIITILGFIMYFVSLVSTQLASVIAFPLEYSIKLLIIIAKFCSKLPFSSVIVKTPYVVELIIYYYNIFVIYNWRYVKVFLKRLYCKIIEYYKKKKDRKSMVERLISVILSIIITFSSAICVIKYNQRLKIYFVDVGQGDCTLICTPSNKTILIDGGGSENSSFDVGEQTLFPYLLDRRITRLDYVIISHMDSDHVGGLFFILENMKINNVVISKQGKICKNYKRFKEIIKQKNIEVIIVGKGDRVNVDKQVYFDILFPSNDLIKENVLNNNSIVAKLHYYNFSMLFTGDIEEIAEEKILEEVDNDLLNADILKIGHHGSKTSSTQEFLEAIKPKIALIGVGKANTFGHPNEGVLERLIDLRYKDL